jgi:Uma2 family endonuclease
MAVNPQPEYLHGIPMTDEMFEHVIGMESPYRYELIDGLVYDMTGSSPEHGTIAMNMSLLLKQQLRKCGSCRIYQDQYVSIPGSSSVVPDVVLTCDLSDWDKSKRLKPFKIQCPLIVVEVLSPSTERYDRAEKFARYQRSPTLEVYMLVSQDEPHVEVYRRANAWMQELFLLDQVIRLDQHDLELPLAVIYEGVF